jgi:ABC-type nitrate/sulfonate/bicarbonate transport system substrate-binding protein
MSPRTLLVRLLAAAVLLLPLAVQAQGLTKIRFSLDWKFEGQTSFFHMAKIKGYYEQEGLDVTIDSGNGSAAAMQRIASGAYDIALGDISALIEFMGNNPGPLRMQAVYQLYDELPLAYFTLRSSNVKSISDLAGKSIASANFEVTRKLWPVISKAAGIAPDSVKWVTIDPSLRVNTVLKGDAVACGGFLNVPLEFTTRGVKAEDVVMMKVSDLGLRGYGNAVIASTKIISENPKAVAGFVRATNRAFREGLADPAASVKYLKQREPLVDEAIEVPRFTMLMPAMLTERTRASGLGAVSKLALEEQVDYVTEAFKLKSKPNADMIFNSSFLPPRSERMPLAGPVASLK